MALPTAGLGSLPSMNVPSYIPVQEIQRRPNIWQQALAQFLGNAAAGAGEKLASNELSGENAPEFGRTSATGWDRLFHGPAVGDDEAKQLRGIKSASDITGMEQSGAMARTQAGESGANTRSQAEIAGRANMQQTADEAAKERLFAELANSKNQSEAKLALDKWIAEQDASAKGIDVGSMAALRGAQTRDAVAQADQREMQSQIMRNALPGSKTTSPAVNPNVAAFAKTSGGAGAGAGDNTEPMMQQGSADRFSGDLDTIKHLLQYGTLPGLAATGAGALADQFLPTPTGPGPQTAMGDNALPNLTPQQQAALVRAEILRRQLGP